MQKITLQDYHELRNKTFEILVEKNLVKDTDYNFQTFDEEFYNLFDILE